MRAALLCCVLWAGAAAELVFHAPEVRVRHETAPARPVGTGGGAGGASRNHLRPRPQRVEGRDEPEDTEELPYQEFIVEHEVSTLTAREAVKNIDTQEIHRRWGCSECTREEIAYCEWQIVADHCCCDMRYKEPYRYIPHTCYMGAEPCRTIAKDCFVFRRLRDCCCDARLAEKWTAILGSSRRASVLQMLVLIGPIVLALFGILQ